MKLKSVLVLVLIVSTMFNCNSDDDSSSSSNQNELSTENLVGTWLISSASLDVIDQNSVTIDTIDPDTGMEGQVLGFSQTEITINDNGQENNLPYTLNTDESIFSVAVEDDKFDVYHITSFNGSTMVLTNIDPLESDFEYDEEYDAFIYEQRTLTFTRQ